MRFNAKTCLHVCAIAWYGCLGDEAREYRATSKHTLESNYAGFRCRDVQMLDLSIRTKHIGTSVIRYTWYNCNHCTTVKTHRLLSHWTLEDPLKKRFTTIFLNRLGCHLVENIYTRTVKLLVVPSKYPHVAASLVSLINFYSVLLFNG